MSGNYWTYVMKTNAVTDMQYKHGTSKSVPFSKNECYDSSNPIEDRKADCSGCEGRFAESPVWPPYRVDDYINVEYEYYKVCLECGEADSANSCCYEDY